MLCPSPILSNTTRHGRIWLPCGKCLACKQKMGKEWFVRLLKEAQLSEYPSYFITLTYSNENIPVVESKNGYTLDLGFDKSHTEKLIDTLKNWSIRGVSKSMRPKNYMPLSDKPVKIKHFTIAERGTLRNRPHYHIMLFNFPYNRENTYDMISKLWNYGFVDVGLCESASLCYITDYCVTKDDEKVEYRQASKGIGLKFCEKNKKHYEGLFESGAIAYKVADQEKTYNMPRYFRHKIFNESQRNVIGKRIVQDELKKYSGKDNEQVNEVLANEEAERINRWHMIKRNIEYKKKKREEMLKSKLKRKVL